MPSGIPHKQLYVELVIQSALRKVKVWVLGFPWGLIQLQESQRECTPLGGIGWGGAGQDVGCYCSYKCKCLKLKSEFRQQEEIQGWK